MRILLIGCGVFLFCLAGCNVQTGLAPLETTIAESSERDFGFVGTWIPTPNPEFDADVDSYQMTIERDGGYTATLMEALDNDDGELIVQFRTHEMSEDHPQAIIEIELKNGENIAYRRLAIAATKDDHLYLWMIDGRKIGKLLYDDGIPAVLEHFTFSTTVRCKPDKLLQSLSKHSSDIVGAVQIFKRKPADGR